MRDRGLVARSVMVGLILGAQVVGVAYARAGDARYLAWAPYDSISQYEIGVTIDGVDLSPEAIVERYQLGLWIDGTVVRGRDNRSVAHVHHLIRRTEGMLGDADLVVTVETSTNGGPVARWTWSP